MRRVLLAVPIIALAAAACGDGSSDYTPTAAAAPSTDIFVGVLQWGDGRLAITDLANITDRDGYDNQPHFLSDGRALLFTSARDTLQTDIYRYDIESGTVSQVTRTAGSEYSPTFMPGGSEFSVIREEASRQQLWKFGLDGSDRGGLLDAVQPVGYHAWGDENTVAMFVLGDSIKPATLQIGRIDSSAARVVAESIGRSLHRMPGTHSISFVHKLSDDEWLIKAIDLDTDSITMLTPTLPGREDYAWLPDGTILMGDGPTLYRWTPNAAWTPVAELSAFGVQTITRIAVSPDAGHIALVSDRPVQ
ncbi:MAG TPA: hypothetical protein VLC48_10930 [Gemmatimonadota bacterium]|nr:hypothetical protein [Gemmatimonadota bacterium]